MLNGAIRVCTKYINFTKAIKQSAKQTHAKKK